MTGYKYQSDMNREALEYHFDNQDIGFTEHEWGYELDATRLSNPTLREIGACNGSLMVGSTDVFQVVEPEDEP